MNMSAGDGQGEPDPGHFERFCRDIVPGILTDVCHADKELAAQVGEDILVRAESYAALGDTARDVLIAPFAEEVVGYEPADSSVELKGAVAVAVRSSLLEEAHSHGPVKAGGIKGITTMAVAPLSHFLAARRRHPVMVERNMFADLPSDFLEHGHASVRLLLHMAPAVAGGRTGAPAAPVPELPIAEFEAPRADNRENAVALSGIDARFDHLFVQRMREVAEDGDSVWLAASLSRISRHLSKLLRAAEYLLAQQVLILTANYLLRTHEVWVRRGELAAVDHKDPAGAWRVSRGLSGAHRALVAKVVQLLEAEEQAAEA